MPSLWLLTLAIFSGGWQAEQRPCSERVEVGRVLLDVRVLDGGGKPITGLSVHDFDVRIEGNRTRVDSVEWIDGRAARGNAVLMSENVAPFHGRLVTPADRVAVLSIDSHLRLNEMKFRSP